MNVAAFIVIAFMLAAYVLLDGYDLGVAAVAGLLARRERERAAAMAAIGPFWNGNEVWLIAAAAALFAFFPSVYAASFSGFYLPFVVVLWLLMFRGIALELRDHFPSSLWHEFWDTAFSWSSALLIFLFGLTLGNLLRGVPLDSAGYFAGSFALLMNPYAIIVALFALVTLGTHGAAFTAMRVEGAMGVRAMRITRSALWLVLALYLVVTALTFAAREPLRGSWLAGMPVVSLAALGGMWWSAQRQDPYRTFLCSAFFIASLLTAFAGTMFPYLLPAYPPGSGGISIFAAAPSPVALSCALTVTLAGIAALALYAPMVWRRMAEKIRVE
jgi:cytochrome bd ubiquinol oxidase subunit II